MFALALTLFVSILSAQESGGQRPPPRGGPPGFGGGPRRGSEQGALAFSAKTLPKNDRERAVLEVLEDMDRDQRRGSMSVPVSDGRLLRSLAEAVGAKQVVEIGTSIGFSGIWFCLALESTGGKLTTFEIDPQRAATARNNFKRAGMDKIVTLIEGDAHQEVSKIQGPVDVLFLDADKEGYADYLEKLLPKVRPGGLVVAHNIDERMADPNYIKAITTKPELETTFLNVGGSGLSITLKKR
jgi:caffeoyl-CoA O-methyltransferase